MSLSLVREPSSKEIWRPYLENPLIAALDVDTDVAALKMCEQLEDIAAGFKVGPRLVVRYGSELLKKITAYGKLFVDMKYFDIPSTMQSAVKASFEAGATFVTVHALAGKDHLTSLAALEAELNSVRPFKILCVTMLTSFDEKNRSQLLSAEPVSKNISQLIDDVKASGLTGLVCSPQDLPLTEGKGLYVVTPGIRHPHDLSQDQKRTASPREALEGGASAYVVGRPIIESTSPRERALGFLVNHFDL
ncbi:MAG: orotidine-5'-phosphate decarboxylase [Bdellovibrionota bacterium]